MALSSGAGPHQAWISVNGTTFPIENGTVQQRRGRKSSTFAAQLPMSFPGVEATFANLGDNTAVITTLTRGLTGTLLTGEIDNVSFDYISRTVYATGRDAAAKLHESMSSEKWQNKKGSDIVQDLAGRLGIGVNAAASSLLAGKLLKQDYVKLSDNVSFFYIINKIAELDGARWWVDAFGTLNYVTSNDGGNYTINYVQPGPGPIASDATHLRISRNVQAGKSVKVTVKSWHPYDKRVYNYTSEAPGNGGPKEYNYHIPNLKQDHVQQYAKARASEVARSEITVDASVAGDPTVNASMGLQLNGTGHWDQVYEIDCVHHSFGMHGHKTRITARNGKGGRTGS